MNKPIKIFFSNLKIAKRNIGLLLVCYFPSIALVAWSDGVLFSSHVSHIALVACSKYMKTLKLTQVSSKVFGSLSRRLLKSVVAFFLCSDHSELLLLFHRLFILPPRCIQTVLSLEPVFNLILPYFCSRLQTQHVSRMAV